MVLLDDVIESPEVYMVLLYSADPNVVVTNDFVQITIGDANVGKEYSYAWMILQNPYKSIPGYLIVRPPRIIVLFFIFLRWDFGKLFPSELYSTGVGHELDSVYHAFSIESGSADIFNSSHH